MNIERLSSILFFIFINLLNIEYTYLCCVGSEYWTLVFAYINIVSFCALFSFNLFIIMKLNYYQLTHCS